MSTINQCFNLLKYRGNSNSYLANLSPDQFNFLWPQAELRFFNAKYKQYGVTKKTNDTLTKVKTVLNITMPTTGGTAGQYTFPSDMLHESSVMTTYNGVLQEVTQFEDDRLGSKLSNSVDPPTAEFPIYVRYNTYLQFYPVTLGTAVLTYLREPTASFWAYTLNGTILTLNTGALNGGAGYGTIIYTGVALTGGTGTGAIATITVTGGVIASVVVTSGGTGYLSTDTLSASNSSLGAIGSGFSIPVNTVGGGGVILTLKTISLIGGSGYGVITYYGIYLAGGSGSGMQATLVVSGGIITSVTLVNGGINYLTTDTLFVNNSFLGGVGSGFSIPVSTILANTPRPTWNPTNSINPVYSDTDIDDIVYLILQDFGVNTRDAEVENFGLNQQKINA